MPKFVFPAIAITLAVLILLPLFTSGPMPKTKDAPDGVTPKASRPTSTDRSRGGGTSTAGENPPSPAVEVATLPISGRGPSGATRLTVVARCTAANPSDEKPRYEVGIRIANYPELWLAAAEPDLSDSSAPARAGEFPRLDHPLVNNLKTCEAAWISTAPLLLHLVTESLPSGSSCCTEREDYIVDCSRTFAELRLRDDVLLYFRAGFHGYTLNTRKVFATTANQHFTLSIQDQSAHLLSDEHTPYALFSRHDLDPNIPQDGFAIEGRYWGQVKLNRKRDWTWTANGFAQTRDEATYRVQPGDKWEDIATYFFNDRTKITQLKSVNAQSTSARPTSNRWIKLPKGASLDQLGTIGEAASDEDKRRWVLGAALNR